MSLSKELILDVNNKFWGDSRKAKAYPGVCSCNVWRIKNRNSTIMLRDAGSNREYVERQCEIIEKLNKYKKGYFPKIIKTKGGDLFSCDGENYFYAYEYMSYGVRDNFSNISIPGFGTMVAVFQKVVRRIPPGGVRSKNIWSAVPFWEKGVGFVIGRTKKNKKIYELLLRYKNVIQDSLDFIQKDAEKKYNTLKRTLVYGDWGVGNMLFADNGEVKALIDYGGVFNEPEIFDLQNAIKNLYTFSEKKDFSKNIKLFLDSYKNISKENYDIDLLIDISIADCLRTLMWLIENLFNDNLRIEEYTLIKELKYLKFILGNSDMIKREYFLSLNKNYKVLYLVRHAQSEANAARNTVVGRKKIKNLKYNSSNVPITKLGKVQAKNLSSILENTLNLSFEKCYASVMVRSIETAKFISDNIVIDKRLHEIDKNGYDLLSEHEIKYLFKDCKNTELNVGLDWSYPGGETGYSVRERISDFLKEIKNEKISVVVSHGNTIQITRHMLYKMKDSSYSDFRKVYNNYVRNCQVVVVYLDTKNMKTIYEEMVFGDEKEITRVKLDVVHMHISQKVTKIE